MIQITPKQVTPELRNLFERDIPTNIRALAVLAGDLHSIFPHLWWVIGYAVALLVVAIAVFSTRMKSDHT